MYLVYASVFSASLAAIPPPSSADLLRKTHGDISQCANAPAEIFSLETSAPGTQTLEEMFPL